MSKTHLILAPPCFHLNTEHSRKIGIFSIFPIAEVRDYVIILDPDGNLMTWRFPTQKDGVWEERVVLQTIFWSGNSSNRSVIEKYYCLMILFNGDAYFFDKNTLSNEPVYWTDEYEKKIYTFPKEQSRYQVASSEIGGHEFEGQNLVRFKIRRGSRAVYFFDTYTRQIVEFLVEGQGVYRFQDMRFIRQRGLDTHLVLMKYGRLRWSVFNIRTRKAVEFETEDTMIKFSRIMDYKRDAIRIVQPNVIVRDGPILLEILNDGVWGLYDGESGHLIAPLPDERKRCDV